MKLLLLLILFLPAGVVAQSSEINIIPKPSKLERGEGHFALNRKTKIVVSDSDGRQIATILNAALLQNYGFKLAITTNDQKSNCINLVPEVLNGDLSINPEGYALSIDRNAIRISGRAAGMFFALKSLFQLMPDGPKEILLPAVRIDDYPRFRYRGMHLDVGRHFMPVEFVKKYIDQMSQYKFNYFHWHLTEDQGWRIEIKKYPRLTEIGSKRPETQLGAYTTTFRGDGIPHSGYYTQKEIKDVVAYAKARYITVIPEIEMPGHSSAALAAYPELGCRQDYNYKVQMTWGIFKEVYCPTEKTFKFLEDVIGEVIELFPDSPYIHIGGDEVKKDMWKESPEVATLMARENLKDEHAVQSYFIHRMEKFINSKGKRIIGWDEILEGGLAPNAVVMSWRGMKGGIDAARAGHDVIMTPTDYSYLDYRQGDTATEPVGQSAYLPLEKVYSFDPMPKELSLDEAKYILGGQGNVWTEYMKTPAAVEYMVFPRMLAMAEAVWSTPENKNYPEFRRRLAAHLPRLAKQKVNYRDPGPLAP
jgi:hexosaminidase